MQLVSADFHCNESGDLQLVGMDDDIHRRSQLGSLSSSTQSIHLMLHRITLQSMQSSADPSAEETFSCIKNLSWTDPSVRALRPSLFRYWWTHYEANVPYRATQLTVQILANHQTAGLLFDDLKETSSK